MDDIRMHVVNNIFLPRKLPQTAFASHGEFVTVFADALAKESEDRVQIKEAVRMMKVWSRVQAGAFVSWELVHGYITKLQPGETFSLHVRAQNAGLTISISETKSESANIRSSATLAVFRVAASSGDVMKAPGDLSDVFPSWAVTTDAERVRNESFAKQVADLANTEFPEMLPKSRKARTDVPETRDVADPSYVTTWLLLAVAGQAVITGEKGVVRVTKKIRDDVLWNNTKLPWRRSEEYMTVKVVLQSTFVGLLGEQKGLVFYKYILIQVMTRILHQDHKKLDTDIVMQMLSKLARRLSKLNSLMDRGAKLLGTRPSSNWSNFSSHIQEGLKKCSETVINIRTFIDNRWQKIIVDKEGQSQLLVESSRLHFGNDITHSLSNAGQHLKMALDSFVQPIPVKVNDPICSNRNIGSRFPNVDYLIKFHSYENHDSLVNTGQALHDIEVWVQKVLWPGKDCREDCTSELVFELLGNYLRLAKSYYEDDVLGTSRMIVTTITLVAMLDFLATRKYPLLLKYYHGVNISVLQFLLLVHRSDMEHLANLETYFATRFEGQKIDISLISEDEPSPEAFSVCFVRRNRHLQQIKKEILEFAARKECEKLEEVSRKLAVHNKLISETWYLSHKLVNRENRYGYLSASHDDQGCIKCQKEQEARGINVDIYERPLPEEAHLQDAVVFELATPTELSVLRDALHVLNKDLLGMQPDSMEKRGAWLDYEPLKRYFEPQKYQKLTTLCSTSKLFSVSHYSSLHIASTENFIKPNGFNVHLMEAGGNSSASSACYKKTEPNISSLMHNVEGAYKCLQWTVMSTAHDENEVLASQAQCPPELSLAEFKAFGSLRAGHLLQIRNISRVLEMQTLTLSQPSVANLFSQVLWQAGPPFTKRSSPREALIPPEIPNSCNKNWVRESHEDLQDQPFAEYMIQQLQVWLERNKENWKDHLGLLSIVTIGGRILELEAGWQEAACGILLSCRVVAESWMKKIEQVLGEMSASSIEKIQAIRSKLVDVAAIAALTFDVSGHDHRHLILNTKADVTSWLQIVARIHDNTLLNSDSSSRSFAGVFQRNLLRRVQNIALDLEEALNNWVTDSDCLSDFVMKHWADANQGQIECWMPYNSPCERWWKATFRIKSERKSERQMILQMDILRGSFLVDGCPVARLPTTITSHPHYRRVFGQNIFQVQPAARPGSFVTTHKLNGSNFTFALVDNNRLLVIERRNDGCELELFPNLFFEKDLPQLLITKHSHWILKASDSTHNVELIKRFNLVDSDETQGCILFRPVKFDDNGFAEIEGIPFVLYINTRRVRDVKTDRNLVDIRSSSFKEVHRQVLRRLELPQFVHIFLDTNDGTVVAELPRMGLGFKVDPKTGIIWSCEQPGFSVSKKQNLGTLIGLQNGLLLEEHDVPDHCIRKQCLIIPHTHDLLKSKMKDYGDLGQHPVVEINLNQFSSPSFFIFEVDDRLQNLRGPASGPTPWLYLALLHASTSHMLPDPFTGLTGTESAMRLLQSPRCWSCMPYRREAISILKAIAKLSPQREWYPPRLQKMQQVKWPEALFSSTALEAFRLVVEKLISDSKRLGFLFPGSDEVPGLPEADLILLCKHYWRSQESIGKEAEMDSENKMQLEGPPKLSPVRMNLDMKEFKRFQGLGFLRSLVEYGHERRTLAVSQDKSLISHLLLNREELKGASGSEKVWTDSTVSTWRKLGEEGKFVDTFLDLYNLAREVQHNHRETFTLLLSVLAYRSVDPRPLSILHCVFVHATEFKDVTPPKYATFQFTSEAKYDMDMVTEAVKRNVITYDNWMSQYGGKPYASESEYDFHSRMRIKYETSEAEDIKAMTEYAQRCWPDSLSDWRVSHTTTLKYELATREINELFTRWHQNIELHRFVANVEKIVVKLCYQAGVSTAVSARILQEPINIPTSLTIQPFHLEMPISLPLTEALVSEAENIFERGQFLNEFDHHINVNQQESNDLPPRFPLQLDDTMSTCEIARKFNSDLETSWREHCKVHPQSRCIGFNGKLAEKLKAYKEKSKSLWREICIAVQPRRDSFLERALEAAGLWRRALPVVLLPCIMTNTSDMISDGVQSALGALAVIWTLEQRVERCLRMLQATKGSINDVALQKELANTGHVNWHPNKHPKWLILELEGDYLMRSIQVDVAKQMLYPPNNENAILQLNMGEGKTSVIVPALCASIPDGERFARLTVLGSLFRMNFDALVSKLGGLLKQRVYTFPYRRDIIIDAHGVQTMYDVYQQCVAKHGVVVMRPEHRLSTILKGLEICRLVSADIDSADRDNAELARKMLDLQDMVEKKARDILDESDLLLHVKYQVVYTVGEQMNLDGGDLRWKVSQSVLQSAQRHCSILSRNYGNEKIEMRTAKEGPYAFPHIRILDASINGELCERVADDILQGKDENLPLREPRRNDLAIIRSFILPPSERPVCNVPNLAAIKAIYNDGPILQTILILRGLLCYGVMMHALQMRWRVQYGVRPSGIPKMAVPFRAKDVPVERAEFGHPDLAIMLTQLSYYHGGLSNAQLLEAFDRLHRSSTRESEYRRWLHNVPLEILPPTLHSLSGVNLDDFVQRTEVLFPVLRRNMQVINFWLSTAVFPIESKMFEGKLVASAWDLSDCSKGGHPVSGFSGTKDTSVLLPSSITQCDLPELMGTDGAVIKKLLQEENTLYMSFPPCISGVEILKQSVVAREARVLLDVGALMIDMSNRNVAIEWLRLINRTQIQAAIYFDDDNQIMSIDRDGRSAPLALSPFHRQMDRCVVYLDDVHTRGTDLKIPHGSHACVTLGQGITKDRLVQACMRMRMLGEGHSVSFWASQEVHTSIMQHPFSSSHKPTSIDVLRWVIRNTVEAIKDGFRHWGSQGIAHSRKKVVSHMYGSHVVDSLQKLGLLSTDPEVTELAMSYGGERRESVLPDIMDTRLKSTEMDMERNVGRGTGIRVAEEGRSVIERIGKYARGVKCFSQVLDEEQERELEHELEEEEELQRPGTATPRKPTLSHSVQMLAKYGDFSPDSTTDFLPLMQAMQGTSKLWELVESRAWSDKLFVTREFATVLAANSPTSGTPFLRPVAWCAITRGSLMNLGLKQVRPVKAIVLLSPFEANALLPDFRRGLGAQLHMFAPRVHQGQSLMLCERPLTLPRVGRNSPQAEPIPDSLIAQLLAFSGSVFFASDGEQDAYCNFLGLYPHPRSQIEDDAFQRSDIELDGFCPPEKRQLLARIDSDGCLFQKSPMRFITKLLDARGWTGHASSSHVGQILFIGQRAQIGNN